MCFSVSWKSSGRYFRALHRTDSAPSHNLTENGTTSTWGSLPSDTKKQLLYVCRRASFFTTYPRNMQPVAPPRFELQLIQYLPIPHHLILDGYDGCVVYQIALPFILPIRWYIFFNCFSAQSQNCIQRTIFRLHSLLWLQINNGNCRRASASRRRGNNLSWLKTSRLEINSPTPPSNLLGSTIHWKFSICRRLSDICNSSWTTASSLVFYIFPENSSNWSVPSSVSVRTLLHHLTCFSRLSEMIENLPPLSAKTYVRLLAREAESCWVCSSLSLHQLLWDSTYWNHSRAAKTRTVDHLHFNVEYRVGGSTVAMGIYPSSKAAFLPRPYQRVYTNVPASSEPIGASLIVTSRMLKPKFAWPAASEVQRP